MTFQLHLRKDKPFFPLVLLTVTSCLTVSPSYSQTVDNKVHPVFAKLPTVGAQDLALQQDQTYKIWTFSDNLPLAQESSNSAVSNECNRWDVGTTSSKACLQTPRSDSDPPQPPLKSRENSVQVPLKRGETLVKVPLFKGDLGGSPGLPTYPTVGDRSNPQNPATNETQPETPHPSASLWVSKKVELSADARTASNLNIYQLAQRQTTPPILPPQRPSSEPQPELPTPSQPPPTEELLQSPPPVPATPEPIPGQVPETITVERFEFEGNTAISSEELAAATEKYTKRPLSFAEVFQVRSVVTEVYKNRGYVTSGAIIPLQNFHSKDGVVKVQVIEGKLEAINVTGLRRLNPNYISSRIARAAGTPLNRNALLEEMQLLQLDPLIKSLSAELSAGTKPGLSLLTVKVEEANTLGLQLSLNNNRSPSLGTFERQLDFTQANLLGQGDGLNFTYSNTNGSNTLDASYVYPLNPLNGTLGFRYSKTFGHVVEPPFNRIDIDADSQYAELTWRQPLIRKLSEEFALGLSATNQSTKVTIFDIPVRLAPGTEKDGTTTVSALRFFQEWTLRSNKYVFGIRSQFSFGLGVLGATVNGDAPDSRFISWRGQAQWLRLLAPDTLIILRGDVQLADRPLLRLEQYGLGGQDTVRGYRQNILLTDNGASVSAEARFPILRLGKQNGLLQIAPFVDLGVAWNNNGNPDPAPAPNVLASAGLGLRFRLGDRLTARADWGFPIVQVTSNEQTLQENGIYFSINYRFF